jgi:hypothetical protein
VRCGAALHDALGREPELREARARAVAGQLDTSEVERGVMEAVAQVRCGRAGAAAAAVHGDGAAPLLAGPWRCRARNRLPLAALRWARALGLTPPARAPAGAGEHGGG